MHRLFLGCNIWSALLLGVAASLGWSDSPHHIRFSIFAAVFCCLVQSGIIALFMGAAKLTKEHVGAFNMPRSLIDRVNHAYHRLISAAAVGTMAMGTAAILAGLTSVGNLPRWMHPVTAMAAFAYILVIIPFEHRLLTQMHDVITDVEKLLPEAGMTSDAVPHPSYIPDRVVMDGLGRAKALLYIGLTLPLPYIGYTFIAGRTTSLLVLLATILVTGLCLAGAAYHFRLARQSSDARVDGAGPAADHRGI